MDLAETRFAHLLQPIRDLAKNWDIDLASQLGEYLEELDQMFISFDGGKTTMNFAEAALLIQGSTCIYGKKVELLHHLVFQTLDCISSKNKKRDKHAMANGDDDAANATAGDKEDDIDFDPLEDESEGSSHTTEMKEDPTEAVAIVRLPPESLISAQAQERQKYSLLSSKGEVLGSLKDFRINNFTLDTEGIMRLGLGSSRPLLQRKHSGIWGNTITPVPTAPPSAPPEIPEEDHDAGDNFCPLEDVAMEAQPELEEHMDRHQAPSERRMLRERPAVRPVPEEPKELKETVDPWKWHDQYATIGEDKPLKTGRCCNVPAGLEESGKRKRKGSSKLEDFWTWCTHVYETSDRKLKNGPTYPDLNYIYVSKMGERVKARKKILRKTGVCVSDEVLLKTYMELDDPEGLPERIRHSDPEVDDFPDDEHENLVDGPAEFQGELDPVLSDSQMDRISYEDLVKKSVELFLVNSQKYIQETALSQRVKDWEDHINPLLSAKESRLAFDIHDYGDRIVNSFSDVGEKRLFASIVKGMDNQEACRFMLASLQLANDYTVEVDSKLGLEESVDSMEMTLLTKQRAHKRLENYTAPSAVDLP